MEKTGIYQYTFIRKIVKIRISDLSAIILVKKGSIYETETITVTVQTDAAASEVS